jgi:hypothetical protein
MLAFFGSSIIGWSSDHHRSSIVIDWIKLYNEATSFSNIAAFSVLFEAPPKFMVIWFFKWTDTAFWVFVSFWFVWFLLIYQDDNPIDSDDYLMIVRKIIIHHHCAQAWPTSQAWWSRRIKLITEYKIECFGTKEMFNKREYSKWPQYRLRLKFCPVHTVLLTSAHAKNGDYAAMLPRQNRVTTRWQRSCSIILHAVHGEFAANFAPVRIGQMRRQMCRQKSRLPMIADPQNRSDVPLSLLQ